MKPFVLLFAFLHFYSNLFSQETLSVRHNPTSLNQSEGDIACNVEVSYKLYSNESGLFMDLTWMVTPGDYLIAQQKKFTRQQLGADVFSQIVVQKAFGGEADAYYQGAKIGTVFLDGSTTRKTTSNEPGIAIGQIAESGYNDKENSKIFPGKTLGEMKKIWPFVQLKNFRLKFNGGNQPRIWNYHPLIYNAIKNFEGEKKPEPVKNNSQPNNNSSNQTNQVTQNNQSSGNGNASTNTKDQQYNQHMQDVDNAVKNKDYAAAQEALNKANSIKPVQNYQAVTNSFTALNNFATTGTTLSAAEVAKTQAIGNLVTTGAQIVGDFIKWGKEKKERETQQKKAAEERIISIKTPIYYSELAKSQIDLIHENNPQLQAALQESYQAPMGDKNLSFISFGSRLFVPQTIQVKELTLKSYIDKVAFVKNGKVTTLLEGQVNGPKIFLSYSRNKMMVAYYSQTSSNENKIAIDVFELPSLAKLGTTLFLSAKDGKINPVGFSPDEKQIVYIDVVSRTFKMDINVVLHDYISNQIIKTIKSEKTGYINQGYLFEEILNNRFLKGVSYFKDFIQLIDLKTERIAIVPRLYVADIIGLGKPQSDSLLGLYAGQNQCDNLVFTFNDLDKYFTEDIIKRMAGNSKKERSAIADLEKTWDQNLHGFPLDKNTQYGLIAENLMVNKIYNEPDLSNIFYKGGDYIRVNCPYDLMLHNSFLNTKGNSHFKTRELKEVDSNKLVAIVDNKLFAYGIFNSKLSVNKYELGYYPMKILDVQPEYISIFGIDQFAFPIVKTYDLTKLYPESGGNVNSTEESRQINNQPKEIKQEAVTTGKQLNNINKTEGETATVSPSSLTITNPKKNTSLSINFSKKDDGIIIGFQLLKDDTPVSFLPTDYATVEITLFGKDAKFHTFNITQTQLGVADGNPEVTLDKTEGATFYKKAVNTNCKLISVVGKAENGQKTFTEMFTLSDAEIKLLQLQIATVAETKKAPAKPVKQDESKDVSKQSENNKKEQENRTTKTSSNQRNTGNQTSNTSSEKSNSSDEIKNNKTSEKTTTEAKSKLILHSNDNKNKTVQVSFTQSADSIQMKLDLFRNGSVYIIPDSCNYLYVQVSYGTKKEAAFFMRLVRGTAGSNTLLVKFDKSSWNKFYYDINRHMPSKIKITEFYWPKDDIKESYSLPEADAVKFVTMVAEIGKK